MTTEIIKFESVDQSMWSTGDASKLEWHKYFPIIGGERAKWKIENETLTSGMGSISADGDRISYDSRGRYDDLAVGTTKKIVVAYDLTAPGLETISRTATIKVKGTVDGPSFTVPDAWDVKSDKFSFAAVTAKDIMVNPHEFFSITPVDINWDLIGELRAFLKEYESTFEEKAAHKNSMLHAAEVQLNHLHDEIVHLKNAAVLAGKLLLTEGAIEVAETAEEKLKYLQDHLEQLKLDQKAADLAVVAAREVKDAAHVAFAAADDGLSVADSALSAAQSALSAVGGFFKSFWGKISGEEEKEQVEIKFGLLNDAKTALSHARNELHAAERSFDAAVDHAAALSAQVAKLTLEVEKALEHEGEEQLEALTAQLHAYETAILTELESIQEEFVGNQIANLQTELDALVEEHKHLEDQLADDGYHHFNFWTMSFGEAETRNKLLANEYRQSHLKEKIAGLQAQADSGEYTFLPTLEDIQGFISDLETDIGTATVNKNALQIMADEVGYAKDRAIEIINSGLEGSDLKVTGKVDVEAHAQAGLQIDFVLSGGEVSSEIDYALTTEQIHRDKSDSIDLKLLLSNETTGDAVAFQTQSPYLKFYAGIVYEVGASIKTTFDMLAKIAGVTLLDVPGDEPILWEKDIGMSGWIDIVSFDSTEDPLDFEVPVPGFLGDILSIELAFPNIATKGYEAKVEEAIFKDPDAFSLDKLADQLLGLLEFDPHISKEFKAFMADHEGKIDATEGDFIETLKVILGSAFDLLTKAGDPKYDLNEDGVIPIFMLTKEGDDDALSDPVIHINTFKDVIDEEGFDLSKMGKLGFYMSTGKSEPVVHVNVDIDQLIATAVAAIAEGGVPLEVINPLDLSFDLNDIIGDHKDKKDTTKTDTTSETDDTPEGEEEPEVEDEDAPLTVDLGFEMADFDIYADLGIEQKFALSIDDMQFNVKLEGNKTALAFKASENKLSVHGSDFKDANGDGKIDYQITITPDARLFNDTELALKLGYVIDFIKAHAKLGLDLPLDKIPGLSLLGIDPSFDLELQLGPIVRMEGNIDALTADLFEDIFEYHAGTAMTEGSFDVFGITLGGKKKDDVHVGHVHEDVLKGGGGHDKLVGKAGDDKLVGGSGNDKLIGGSGDDNLSGGGGDDLLKGGGGHDKLVGDAGNDTLKGGGGSDRMDGGINNDKLIGGGGKDIIEGGLGDDVMKGGGGQDVFIFDLREGGKTGSDKIKGFDAEADTLKFFGITEVSVSKSRAGTKIDFEGGDILLQKKSFAEGEISIEFV